MEIVNIYIVGDDKGFVESEHPRDEDGKFTTGSGGSGGSSGSKQTKPGVQVGKTLKAYGFKKSKDEDKLSFVHPSGVKVVIHPKPGTTYSSIFSVLKGEHEQKGFGAELVGYLEKALAGEGLKPKPQEAPKPDPASSHQQNSQAIEFLNGLGSSGWLPTINPGPKNSVMMKKKDGSLLQYNFETKKWISQSFGHLTKEGEGIESLQQLMSGQKPANPPWKNTSETLTDPDKPKEPHEEQIEIYKSLEQVAPEPEGSEISALHNYSGSGYAPLNDKLRHFNKSAQNDPKVKALDSYLARAPLPEEVTVYRGLKGEFPKILKSIAFVGSQTIAREFLSSSPVLGVASNFSHGLLLKMRLPKGTHAAAIGNYSPHPSEREVLIARNSILVCTAYDPENNYMEVDVIQPGVNDKTPAPAEKDQ